VIPIKDNLPKGPFPFVTIGLIVANFVVYILAIRHGGSFFSGPSEGEVFKYGAIPNAVLHPGVHCAVVAPASNPTAVQTLCNTHLLNQSHIGAQNLLPSWETIFTGMFMHASILHIGGNMIFLWIFGNNVEGAMGPVKYLIFYILGGLAAFALQLAVGPGSTTPTLGASGAIAAVLGGYIVLYPRARVLTFVFIIFFFTVIELPAWVLLGVWFAEQAVFGATGLTTGGGSGGGVAYFAHVGGFVFGLAAIKLFARKARPAYA
jgi:membrane associated rhomboid family serine protease